MVAGAPNAGFAPNSPPPDGAAAPKAGAAEAVFAPKPNPPPLDVAGLLLAPKRPPPPVLLEPNAGLAAPKAGVPEPNPVPESQ